MKKFLLTIALFLMCSTAHATVWFACTSGGIWSTNVWTSVQADQGTCAAALGTPVAGDTATLNSSSGSITINGATAAAIVDETGYTGTLAFATFTITTTGADKIGGAMTSTSGSFAAPAGVTLLSTATGTFPTLKITGASTLTAGGFTWPGALNLSAAGNVVLSGNWVNTGLVTISAATNLNVTTAETLEADGGITLTSGTGTTGTATYLLNGGTWSGNFLMDQSLTITPSVANVTVTGPIQFGRQTLTYAASTFSFTTTGTLAIQNTCTLNTGGITWVNLTQTGILGTTITLSSDLNISGLYSAAVQASPVISGAHNIYTGSFSATSAATGALSYTFPAGQTLNVANSLTIEDIAIKSGTASSPFYINYTGGKANQSVAVVNFTDVYASNKIWDFVATAIVRCANIIAFNASNIKNNQINYYNGV